ncbi:ribonuclease HII [Thalassobacillus pellis]|uniref:ribonuclease HII n=1 Tax=Thalassobacillus pellis TaxID=748008 RepID=UPI0019612B91|nr:ribonuclease HII [Thalassobacillus pellis]MBM7552768.1 ribonuclease HII [Thalassobacillus pellis]
MVNKITIAKVKELLDAGEITESFLMELQQDERKGIQKLLKTYNRNRQRLIDEEHNYREMMAFEQLQYKKGHTLVAGIDEAGRGPLAGPVVAACVILHKDYYLPGLNDSKQLSKDKRELFYEQICQDAFAYGIGMASSNEIDHYNIYQATKLAMRRSVECLGLIPDHILIDAMTLDGLPCSQQSLIKGDQRSVSIAAASILAKVKRDELMREVHEAYPMYAFRSNQGYATAAHRKALEEYGPSPYHRKSFAPVQEWMNV